MIINRFISSPSNRILSLYHIKLLNDQRWIMMVNNHTPISRRQNLHKQQYNFSSKQNQRLDPTAKRPTKVCDPYGLNGSPLSFTDAMKQLPTLENGWYLQDTSGNKYDITTFTNNDLDINTERIKVSHLKREFHHDNYIHASKFLSTLSAVAYNNNHYPTFTLERRLMERQKAWSIITTVSCYTPTLKGLSYHDFHIAMLMDVEILNRMDVQQLLLPNATQE